MPYLAFILALIIATSAQQQGEPSDVPIQILQQSSEINTNGSFRYSYKTENGISVAESGFLKNAGTPEEAQSVEGSYSYTAPDGVLISLKYTADENGFKATGDHLPVAPTIPPIPYLIAKSLAYNAAKSGVVGDNEYKTSDRQNQNLQSVSEFRADVSSSDRINGKGTIRNHSDIGGSDNDSDGSGDSDSDDSDDSDDGSVGPVGAGGAGGFGGSIGESSFHTGGAGFE